jgi:hypothetical protein
MTQPTDGGQSTASGTGQSTGSATDGTTGTQASGAGQSTQQQAAPETVTKAEHDQLRDQLAAADRNKAAAEAKLKEMQDAALSEEERRKRDLETAQETLKVKDEKIKELQIDLAFLRDNTHDWHNPTAALALADKSKLSISDDGKTVNGLKEALEAVAKTHPYLLKPKDGTTEGAGPPGVTGVAGQGSAPGQSNQSAAALAKRFPALKGRVS